MALHQITACPTSSTLLHRSAPPPHSAQRCCTSSKHLSPSFSFDSSPYPADRVSRGDSSRKQTPSCLKVGRLHNQGILLLLRRISLFQLLQPCWQRNYDSLHSKPSHINPLHSHPFLHPHTEGLLTLSLPVVMAEIRRKLVIVGDGACGKTCLLM